MAVIPSRSKPAPPDAGPRLVLRIDLAGGARIGPGKIALLEAIASAGSISGGGRALKMSYRRAWELVEDLNRHFGTPVVATAAGGSGGGGARLTEAGALLVRAYRAIETAAADSAAPHLAAFGSAPRPPSPSASGAPPQEAERSARVRCSARPTARSR